MLFDLLQENIIEHAENAKTKNFFILKSLKVESDAEFRHEVTGLIIRNNRPGKKIILKTVKLHSELYHFASI